MSKARRLATRSFREQNGRFLVEGPQAVRAAAAHVGGLEELFLTADAKARHPDVVAASEAAGAEILLASGEVVAALSGTVTPQGMVAVARHIDVPLRAIAPNARLVAVLSHVRDPGNAGTVIRAADAAGADAVVLTDASVDPYNGKCVRATAGSLFHLPIVRGVPVADAVDQLRAAGLRVLAADGGGAEDLDDLIDDGSLARPTAWLFGNEAWGLPPEVRDLADAAVRVPIHGRAESLNLASAATVCLYASARAQRRTSA